MKEVNGRAENEEVNEAHENEGMWWMDRRANEGINNAPKIMKSVIHSKMAEIYRLFCFFAFWCWYSRYNSENIPRIERVKRPEWEYLIKNLNKHAFVSKTRFVFNLWGSK